MKRNSKNKYGALKILICVVGLFFLIVAIKAYYEQNKIDKNHVIVLGSIIHVESVKNGRYYKYNYRYKGEVHTHTFQSSKSGLKEGDAIFVKVAVTNPDFCDPLYEIMVPDCVAKGTIPPDGWKELPTCN